MGRSQETFNKKEREKKRRKKRQEKLEKKEERKSNSNKGKRLEEMFSYVDENGNLTSTPPDPSTWRFRMKNVLEKSPFSMIQRDSVLSGTISHKKASSYISAA